MLLTKAGTTSFFEGFINSKAGICNVCGIGVDFHSELTREIREILRRELGLNRIEPRDEAVDSWVARVNASVNATLPPHAKHTWTICANVPGKPPG